MRAISATIFLMAMALLSACDKPQPPAAPAPAAVVSERAGPVRWNGERGAFEMNGQPLRTAKLWTFEGSTDGFTGVGSKVAPAAVGDGLEITIADPTLRSPKGLEIVGAQYSLVLVRLTRLANGEAWDGALYYSTPSHPEAIGYLGKPKGAPEGPALNETVTLVYDMSRPAAGGTDWMTSVIDQIRLDIEDRPGGRFLIRQIAIAENPDAAPLPAPAAEPTEAANGTDAETGAATEPTR